jgi:hypothetical protein
MKLSEVLLILELEPPAKHALRRGEICKLRVNNFRLERHGVPHLKISGKGGKTRAIARSPVVRPYYQLASSRGLASKSSPSNS